MVLFAALLAPVIFAVGLLAGEMGRYERVGDRPDEGPVPEVRAEDSVPGVRAEGPVPPDRTPRLGPGEWPTGIGPAGVPVSPRPVRRFVGLVPPRVTPRPLVVEEPRVVEKTPRSAEETPRSAEETPGVTTVVDPAPKDGASRGRERKAEAPRVEPTPTPTAEACPGEWRDTWLWEVCREHERAGDVEASSG